MRLIWTYFGSIFLFKVHNRVTEREKSFVIAFLNFEIREIMQAASRLIILFGPKVNRTTSRIQFT